MAPGIATFTLEESASGDHRRIGRLDGHRKAPEERQEDDQESEF